MTRRLLLVPILIAVFAPAAHAASSGALVQLPGPDACIGQTGADAASGRQCRDGSGLAGVDSIAISPDGKNAYTTGFRGALGIMARDPATGALSPLGCVTKDGNDFGSGSCATLASLSTPDDVVVSPDGQNVYVGTDAGLVSFSRDPATGGLTQLPGKAGCITEDGSGGTCVDGKNVDVPFFLAISPNGASLYAADSRGGIAILRRAPDGALSQSTDPQAGCITEDGRDQDNLPDTTACVDGKALSGSTFLAMSPDGHQVYVTSFTSDAVAVLDRDSTTGELSQSGSKTGCVSETGHDGTDSGVCTDGKALGEPGALAMSPDGLDLYVASSESDGLAVLDRNPATGALTPKAGVAGCLSRDGNEHLDGPGTCAVARGVEEPDGVAVSPSGNAVYVGSFVVDPNEASPVSRAVGSRQASRGVLGPPPDFSGGIASFARDPASGTLQQLPGSDGCVNEVGGALTPLAADACAPGTALQGVNDIVLSPDGANVYASAQDSNAVAEFALATVTPAPPGAQADTTAPKISRFSITHRLFAVGAAATPVSALAHGTAFRFVLSEAARVRISIQRALPGRRVGRRCRKISVRLRHHRACTRFVTAGALRRGAKAGSATVRFSGRIGRRALKPGRYRATIVATDAAGNASKKRSVGFRVVKPHKRRL